MGLEFALIEPELRSSDLSAQREKTKHTTSVAGWVPDSSYYDGLIMAIWNSGAGGLCFGGLWQEPNRLARSYENLNKARDIAERKGKSRIGRTVGLRSSLRKPDTRRQVPL